MESGYLCLEVPKLPVIALLVTPSDRALLATERREDMVWLGLAALVVVALGVIGTSLDHRPYDSNAERRRMMAAAASHQWWQEAGRRDRAQRLSHAQRR